VKTALVHDWLTGMRGGEKCLEVLCRRFPEARLFTLLHVPGSTSPAIERMPITPSFLQKVPGAGRHYRYLLPLMPTAVQRLRIPEDVDLVVSFSHAVAKSVRPPKGVPHVCYCFTPMRYAWHRRADYFVNSGRFINRPVASVRNMLLDRIRQWDRETADRVTHFVAISQTIAERIAQSYGRASRIIYPPVDTRFYFPSQQPREDWYLCVSALVPYKRIDLAIEACNRLGRKLVVIGSGPEEGRLSRLAGPTVKLAGWRTDEEIRDHLRRCRALLFPGNEDFGIVPVEAQACGAAVIAFGEGGATETVLAADGTGPGTGLFFDNQTPESLVSAICRLEAGPEQFSRSLARRQAERFSTQRFERELVGYLEEVRGLRKHDCCSHTASGQD
jgi:glycosyltransferase involved in cell wall biosynthesis